MMFMTGEAATTGRAGREGRAPRPGRAGRGGHVSRARPQNADLPAIPPAPPPHGTVWAYQRGCRCGECEAAFQECLREFRQRSRLSPGPEAVPTPPRLSADARARADPAVRESACPTCDARPFQRCRNLHFPLHYAPTHPARLAAHEASARMSRPS